MHVMRSARTRVGLSWHGSRATTEPSFWRWNIIYPLCIIGHTLINTKPKTFLTRVPSWILYYFGLLILSVTRRTVKLKPWPTLPRAPHYPHIKHMPPDWARLVRGEDYDVLTYGQDTTFCGGTPTGHCPLMWGQNLHNKSRHSEK